MKAATREHLLQLALREELIAAQAESTIRGFAGRAQRYMEGRNASLDRARAYREAAEKAES